MDKDQGGSPAMGSASGGSLAGASKADLARGYTDAAVQDHSPDTLCCCPMCLGSDKRGGFLDRPAGWER